MFRRFRVQNFMCLKDVTVDLEPLTVFIGPNSSGKSALFKAMATLSRLLYYPVRGGQTGDFTVDFGTTLDDAVWNTDSSFPVIFHVWFWGNDTDAPDYVLELRRSYVGWSVARERFWFHDRWLDTGEEAVEFETSSGRVSWASYRGHYTAPMAYLLGARRYRQDSVLAEHARPIRDLREHLGQTRRYRPSASEIASFTRVEVGEQIEVNEAGRGVSAALQDVLTANRDTLSAIEADLHELHDHIREITFKSDYRGTGLFYRTARTGGLVPASLESDGVLLSTFLLWRLHTARPTLNVCLEEPENGVHVSALRQRYELLKRFSEPRDSRDGVQILVATHSRDFLNAIHSRTDILREVRVTEFSEGSGTAVRSLNHYREIDQLLDEFKGQLGDLWWSNRLEGRLRQSG